MGTRSVDLTPWHVALRLGRVSNLPTVWTNVLAASALAGSALAGAVWDPASLGLLLVAGTLFYVGGMFLNDAFDHRIDGVERPERPIPSGLVRPRTVFVAGFSMLAAALLLLVPFGTAAVVAGLALAGTIVFYDAHHKANPLSPLVMGGCRALLYITVGFAVTDAPEPFLWVGAGAACAYVVGLTYTAKSETLARVEKLWPLAVLALPFVLLLPATVAGGWTAAAFFLLFLAWTVRNVRLVVQGVIGPAVGAFIAGIALLDAAFLASVGAVGAAVAAVAAWALTLLFQRRVPGT